MVRPVSFGYKMAWLAVRSDSPEDVAAGLGVEARVSSSWDRGVETVYSADSMTERPVFVTPSLDGWVLAVSPVYFEEASDADPERLSRFVSTAAELLGAEVQLFVTHRVVEGHAWARADESGLKRAYYYLGEVGECLLDQGPKTSVEDGLGCFGLDPAEPADESTVMEVARAWSIDPTGIEDRYAQLEAGILGTIPPLSAHDGAREQSDSGKPWWKFW